MSRIRNLWVVCIIGIVTIIVLPFLVEWMSDWWLFKNKKGDFNAWLGFLGSYIGGIISGITTLLGIYIGIQYEKNKQRNDRAIKNRQILHEAHDWCFSVRVILEDIVQKDLTREIIDTDECNDINKKARELEEKIVTIDFEWYEKMNSFRKGFSDITWSILQHKGDKKKIQKLIKELDLFWKELLRYY